LELAYALPRQRTKKSKDHKSVMAKKNVLLITNMKEDRQFSMLQFGEMLKCNLSKNYFDVDELYPVPKFQKLFKSSKIKKWGGYLDKYYLFPKKLKRFLNQKYNSINLIHIIDHSNSLYLSNLANFSIPNIITCHDLIAIRTAQEEFSQAPRTSYTGTRLQYWIKKSLHLADFFACDSSQTEKDLNQVIKSSEGRSEVIHLGVENKKGNFNHKNITLPFDPRKTLYLLHVGTAAWYKNRRGIIEAFKNFCEKNSASLLKLVLVGPIIQDSEVPTQTLEWLKQNQNKVTIIKPATEQELNLLYQNANLFLFPSFIEGFGWPPLEAASHGCPIITTRTGAISDILGVSAIYVDPNDQEQLNLTLINSLKIKKDNISHPSLPSINECVSSYAKRYEKLIENS
jgi:glycosyltransferase involved in cell wall biosynthesis